MNLAILLLSLVIVAFRIAPHWAILAGVIITLTLPQASFVKTKGKALSARLLQVSVVFLGAGLNFQSVLKEGSEGVVVTFISISGVFLVGLTLARMFQVEKTLSLLITSGTSICGGSAISAVSPVLKADNLTIATALGLVFILNATAVFLFPPIATFLQLSQKQFGTWAALAIHDTSSVVAASQIYGEEALKIGATLKLTRALWIIPLTLVFAFLKKSDSKITFPWFILYFLLFSLAFTFIQPIRFLIPYFSLISKAGLSLTLFFIGLGLNKEQLRKIGKRPVLFGIVLWFVTLSLTLIYVLKFV